MKKYLFQSKAAYKANLHCHTNISDGTHTPEEIKAMYTAKGYSIVAFTDHHKLVSHQHLSDDNFLAISACEMDLNQPAQNGDRSITPTYHINLFATRSSMVTTPPLPTMDYHDTHAINQYIADRTAEGFLVSYNHPLWSLQTYEEYSKLKGLFGVEIYNHGCQVGTWDGYSPHVYDEMLRQVHNQGGNFYCLSTDDNHNWAPVANQKNQGLDSFGGFLYVNSKSLKYDDVMDALKKGDFHSSQGPKIDEISLDGNTLTVKCSPAQSVVVYTTGRKCYQMNGDSLLEASFELAELKGYIRVMCRDKNNNDANSNAYWL